jgi:O-antigen/teichoic acid export membrane protein
MSAFSFKQNIKIQFAGNILFSLLMVGVALLTARVLGPADRGLLRLAQLLPLIVTKIFSFGLDISNAAFPGLYPDRRRELFVFTLLLSAAGSILGMVCMFLFFTLPIPRGQFDSLTVSMIWLSILYVPMFLFAQNLMTLVRGCGQLNQSVRVQLIQTGSLLGMLLIFVLRGTLTVQVSLVLFALCCLPGIGLALWFLGPYLNLGWTADSGPLLRKSLRFGVQVSLSHIAGFLVLYMDQFMLGYMSPLAQVGQYMIAVSLAERLRLLPNAISMAFLPHLTNDLKNRQAEVPRVFRLTLLVSVLSVIPYGGIGTAAIWIFLGRPYAGSILPFLILIFGVALVGGSEILSGDLAARQKPKYSVINGYLSFGLNVVLNLIWIPRFGICGAALASLASYAFSFCLWILYYRRESGIPLGQLRIRLEDLVFIYQSAIRLPAGWFGKNTGGQKDLPEPSSGHIINQSPPEEKTDG